MPPRSIGIRFARPLVVFALLAAAALPARAAVTPVPDVPLDDGARRRLELSAGDPSLDAWQRDFMRRLAAGRSAAAGERAAEAARAEAQARLESGPSDGSWVRLPPPPPRSGHSSIYDPIRNRMIVYGGMQAKSDVWELRFGASPVWREILPAGEAPPGRYGQSAVYDPVRDRMIVFGGVNDYGVSLYDVWALSLSGPAAWTRIEAVGDSTLLRRYRHSAIYDPIGDRMIVFGGSPGPYGYYTVLPDCWELPLSGPPVWSMIVGAPDPVAGMIPARDQHTAFYDFVRQRMLVYGGRVAPENYGDPSPSDDVWVLSLTGNPEWTHLVPDTTLADTITTALRRAGHAAAYDALRDRLVVFSGLTTGPYYYSTTVDNLTLALDLGSLEWSVIDSTGVLPSAREWHTAIYDAVDDRIVMYGLQNYYYSTNESDIWSYQQTDTAGWRPFLVGGGQPAVRFGQSAVYDEARERVLVFGGISNESGQYLNDTWALTLRGDPIWSRLDPAGTPPAGRTSHSAVYDRVRDRMLVFGGYGGAYRNDVWALSLSGPVEWTRLFPTGGPPSSRVDHAAIYDPDGDRMIVFGGFSGLYRDDTWQLSLSGTPAWTQLLPPGEWPSPRYAHTAIWDEPRHRMVVFGGQDGLYSLNDVWALATDGGPAWSRLVDATQQEGALRAGAATDAQAPIPRSNHVAIYDANRQRMVIHGGYGFTPYGSLQMGDVWALPLAGGGVWTQLAPGGADMGSVAEHAASYDPRRDLMVVLPGSSNSPQPAELQWTGVVSAPEPGAVSDLALSLAPNPARGAARIALELPREADVQATLLDIAGRRLRDLARVRLAAGRHTLHWDGRDALGARAPAGVYFVRVRVDGRDVTKRFVLLE